MNAAAILALVGELYQQVSNLKAENAALKQRMQVIMAAQEMHSVATDADGGETHD